MPTNERILEALKKAYFLRGYTWNDISVCAHINYIIRVLEDIYEMQTMTKYEQELKEGDKDV